MSIGGGKWMGLESGGIGSEASRVGVKLWVSTVVEMGD